MDAYIIISGGGSVAAAGAWLKWSAAPVLVAYRLGRMIGRIQGTEAAGR
jgi:hypothetical protein